MRKPRIAGKATPGGLFSSVAPRFIEVRADNGLPVKAPIEVWIAGIMQVLTPEQRRNLMEVVGRLAPPGIIP